MLALTHKNIKNQSCHLHCQFAYSTQSGKPLYLTGFFDMVQDLKGEIWKHLTGCAKHYMISNFSRIKVLAHIRSNGHRWKEHLLKQSVNDSGYYVVNVTRFGKSRPHLVHRMFAEVFIPNPENKGYINHKNKIKTDNRRDNLEWCSNRENVTHAWLTIKTTSDYTGVYWNTNKKRWVADIRYNKKKVFLGMFRSELEASQAYQLALHQINDGTFVIPTRKKPSSIYKGVYFSKQKNKWHAVIYKADKTTHVGFFNTEIEAYEARKKTNVN